VSNPVTFEERWMNKLLLALLAGAFALTANAEGPTTGALPAPASPASAQATATPADAVKTSSSKTKKKKSTKKKAAPKSDAGPKLK
jgi:hypothetical protein